MCEISDFRLLPWKFHHICTLIGSFFWKYIRFQLKKYTGVMSHDTEQWCTIWRKTYFCFKIDKNLVNLTRALESPKNVHFGWFSFCAKYTTFDLKKYRGVVIFHDTKEWCKIWRKAELWFEKWHEKFCKISPEPLKVSKLGLWWDPFVQSRKCMS